MAATTGMWPEARPCSGVDGVFYVAVTVTAGGGILVSRLHLYRDCGMLAHAKRVIAVAAAWVPDEPLLEGIERCKVCESYAAPPRGDKVVHLPETYPIGGGIEDGAR